MVRSMYSGVSGLRSHQTRMDTIGNNIANVNTYGYKSGRTAFRDIYYQTMSSASQPTAAQGGVNPSAVGYGAKVGSIDLMMTQSTFSMTDYTMDVAIDGEGFFQVQDAGGNTYYTRAGMLNFDAAGNLVDMQGNFVLGINGDPTGKPASNERIQVALPVVPPTAASVVQSINGLEYTISASNPTKDGNMNFNFTTDSSLADGEVVASISTSGIIIKMNPNVQFQNMNDLNTAINAAITQANNNETHPAGDFTVEFTGDPGDDPFAALAPGEYITAAEMCSTNYNIVQGSVKFTSGNSMFGGVKPSGTVGNTFGNAFTIDPPEVTAFDATYDAAAKAWNFVMTVGGVDYKGSVDSSKNTSGKFNLYADNGDSTDFIQMSRPSFDVMTDTWINENGGPGDPGSAAQYTLNLDNLQAIAHGGAGLAANDVVNVGGTNYAIDPGAANSALALADLKAQILATPPTGYSAYFSGNSLKLTANAVGVGTTPGFAFDPSGANTSVTVTVNDPGKAPVAGAVLNNGQVWSVQPADLGSATTVKSSEPSKSLGFSGAAFALRGGTEGGPQTIADMTGIAIAANGIITGWDSTGAEIIVGRIDLVTFANPAGLNQAGSSYYTESANSGDPVYNQPGTGGAGQLVGGTLELSNVDLSREFSDMITTQRGYQANSRIITVSDTMLEELINLKR